MGFLREPSHLLILLLVVIVLFGAKRLPDSARALGRSLRIFKAEIKDLDEKRAKKRRSRRLARLNSRLLIGD
jgi:sec-independent protein translocase protein TatA